MNVKTLKAMIADLPDEALVLIEGRHGGALESRVMKGHSTEIDQGFADFSSEKPNESYIHEAVYFYRPM